MMKRLYAVSTQGKPDDMMIGGFAVGAFNAAINYAGIYLAGWTVLPGCFEKTLETKQYGLHDLWRFEAINADQTLGCVIWVRELNSIEE